MVDKKFLVNQEFRENGILQLDHFFLKKINKNNYLSRKLYRHLKLFALEFTWKASSEELKNLDRLNALLLLYFFLHYLFAFESLRKVCLFFSFLTFLLLQFRRLLISFLPLTVFFQYSLGVFLTLFFCFRDFKVFYVLFYYFLYQFFSVVVLSVLLTLHVPRFVHF